MSRLQTTSDLTEGAQQVHRIDIREIDYTNSGPVYLVKHEGAVLIPRSWDPATEAARLLIARGCNPNDRIELWGREPYARLRGRLGFAAGMTVTESATRGPAWAPYVPYAVDRSGDAVSRVSGSAPAAVLVSDDEK